MLYVPPTIFLYPKNKKYEYLVNSTIHVWSHVYFILIHSNVMAFLWVLPQCVCLEGRLGLVPN